MNYGKVLKFVKDNAGNILTLLGCVGFAGTTALAVKTGYDIANDVDIQIYDDKKELVKKAAPVVLSVAAAIACVCSGNVINARQKKQLVALCMASGSSYAAYRKEIRKRFGEEVDKEIADTVAANCEVCCMCSDIPDRLVHWSVDLCIEGLPILELDAYERDIINAERHLNRNYIMRGCADTAELLEFLGFAKLDPEFSNYGWDIQEEIFYVDFEHEKVDDQNFIIHPIFAPWYEYDRLNMMGDPYFG